MIDSRRGLRGSARQKALLCLALALAAAGADLRHQHALGVEATTSYSDWHSRSCARDDQHNWVNRGQLDLSASAADPCLACRWQRGPLPPSGTLAPVPTPPPPARFSRSLCVSAPAAWGRPGFLDRAPPFPA